MTTLTHPEASQMDRSADIAAIEERILWLSTAIVGHANLRRPNPDRLKVGGHQASSASMVSIMTALWFNVLQPEDRVSVKPHASPVLHSINYLLGSLTRESLTTLRQFGGLQSYPSRAKDPDPVDYSTGSVGIGATAPIWGAIARRYVNAHFAPGVGTGRQYSLLGDAELDEGACWEAIVDPMVSELGEIVWVVDLNRQSLDRVVPNIAAARLQGMFSAAGWQVITAKYGRVLEDLFENPGGPELRNRLDEMSNPEYQRLLRATGGELRARLPGDSTSAGAIRQLLESLSDDELVSAIRNLGGHDIDTLTRAFEAIDDTRPTVIFAYTVKGHGLPTAGHPQNHSALLSEVQMHELADRLGLDWDDPWATFADDSGAARLCAEVSALLSRTTSPVLDPPSVPLDLHRVSSGSGSTQQALGRVLMDLTRQAPTVASRVVTVTPDVASSTNLGGWLNKVGNWSTMERRDWFADDSETILHWRERPSGQHLELGIAEVNLVGLIGELGATWSRWGQPLLPIGVLYDPFVSRALEPWSFGIYAGGQSILVGTPSGVTLAAEGGAHQSIGTPSIGIEQPECTSYEPAFVADLEWCLLASMAQLGRRGGRSAYLRLSTLSVDQELAQVPADGSARERRRQQVVAGAYILRHHPTPHVTLVAMGAVTGQVLEAAGRLSAQGVGADVVCVTSPDLLYRAMRARTGRDDAGTWILDQAFPQSRSRPMVTVLDGHPHALAFLSGVHGVPSVNLGVSGFGQSGDLADTYRYHGIDADSVVRAALDVLI